MSDWLTPALICLGFPLVWIGILRFASAVSGWRALAAQYPAREPFSGPIRRFEHIRLGWSNYQNCVNVGASGEGLYLTLWFLFRPFHPPLFIPWSELSAKVARGWLVNRLELRFNLCPGIILLVSEQLGRQIAADANRAWSVVETYGEPSEPSAS